MKKEELAALLNGREYRKEITKIDEQIAKSNNLVVVFGASDDLMEFRGAISDEADAWEGVIAPLNKDGIIERDCINEDCPYFQEKKRNAKTIEQVWDDGSGYSWTYKTEIPHATFDILEDGEKYCKGIVFEMKDLGE